MDEKNEILEDVNPQRNKPAKFNGICEFKNKSNPGNYQIRCHSVILFFKQS